MLAIKIKIFLYLLIFLITSIAQAQTVKVVDGDTIHVDGEKIRFSGIDAPELSQTCILNSLTVECGLKSREILINKIANKLVECIAEGKDRYKRILAECFVENTSLSDFLVREGYAFAYRQYSNKFISAEEEAKMNQKGMWSMQFIFPWDFRKLN